jgi:D-amino-acid dehydrogenase
MPVIDFSPKHDNLIIAAGHNMQGMSMAPKTGKIVSDLVEGISPDIDLSYYSANRF